LGSARYLRANIALEGTIDRLFKPEQTGSMGLGCTGQNEEC